MNLIAPRASHWYEYTADGIIKPAYEMPNKSQPGQMRKTTLADARKLSLWTSVTNVLSIINKPALNDWRVTQGILAALTLPRNDGEPLDEFASRVATDMDKESEKARDFGTKIHDAIDRRLLTLKIPDDEDPAVTPYLDSSWKWLLDNIKDVKRTEYYDGFDGVAGRIDMECVLKDDTRAILDWKTQRVRKTPAFYKEWGYQLGAYGRFAKQAIGIWPRLFSIVINSVEPSQCGVLEWTNPDKQWQMFLHAKELWQHDKDYRPGVGLI